MPLLVGFYPPLKNEPCFVIPAFIENPGSNQVYVQNISQSDTAESFDPVEMGTEDYSTFRPEEALKIEPGEKAIWAFQKNNSETIYGHSQEIRPVLSKFASDNYSILSPIIHAQIAYFCNDNNSYHKHARSFFDTIHQQAPFGAEIWRDAVIILPTVKAEMASLLPPNLKHLVNQMRFIGTVSYSRIEAPQEIFSLANDVSHRLRLTQNLCATFGLSQNIEVKSHSAKQSKLKSEPNPPTATIEGFGSTGRLIASSLVKGPNRKLLPVGAKPIPRARINPINFSVAILAVRDDEIANATAIRQQTKDENISIAIVVQTNVSTYKRNDLIKRISILKDSFDYVFVIENPLLSFRQKPAPQLALAGLAEKYVRACIDGVLQIVWADTGPTSRADFLRIFPTSGFCLVGRALGDKDNSAIYPALTTMLNEYLPRDRTRRFVAIGSAKSLDSPSGRSFISERILIGGNRFITVETPKRRGVTLLAFGIEPAPLSNEAFGKFCDELMTSLGWDVSERDSRKIVHVASSNRAEKTSLRYACFVAFDLHQDALDSFVRKNIKGDIPDMIFTNFRPSRVKASAGRRSIKIVHYSELPKPK